MAKPEAYLTLPKPCQRESFISIHCKWLSFALLTSGKAFALRLESAQDKGKVQPVPPGSALALLWQPAEAQSAPGSTRFDRLGTTSIFKSTSNACSASYLYEKFPAGNQKSNV